MLAHTLFTEPCNENSASTNKFSQHCNDLLRQLDPTQSAMLNSYVWEVPFSHYNYQNSTATLDFSVFEQQELMFVEQIAVTIDDGEVVELTPIGFAKWLLLEHNHCGSVDYRIVWYLDRLKMLFAFLKEKQLTVLGEEDLEDFLALLLTHDFSGNSFVKRFSIPAYGTRFKRLDLQSIYRTLKSHNISVLLNQIDNNAQDKALNSACLTQGNLTLSDYKGGGSFDFLGLDVGRHYVDFCAGFFEENVSYATAVRKSLEVVFSDIEEQDNLTDDARARLKKEVVEALMGVIESDSQLSETPLHESKQKRESKQTIRRKTLAIFCQNYNEIIVSQKAFTLNAINSIAKKPALAG